MGSVRIFRLLGLAALVLSESARAEEQLFLDLTAAATAALPARAAWESPLPARFRSVEVDVTALEELLARAPAERAAGAPPLIVALPYPDGTDRRFVVAESPILEPTLAAAFPEIRTFIAQGIDDPSAIGRLSLTALGFHALLLSTAGTVYVDPWRRGESGFAISYFKVDARRAAGKPFHCEEAVDALADDESGADPGNDEGVVQAASGTELRTYRLAVAANGEYSTAVCTPNPVAVACAMNAMAVTMNRVNGIYERDLAMRMVLIANDDQLVYTDGATDPYTNGNASTMAGQNTTNLNLVIGEANYDIGHVFSTGGGGVGTLNGTCGMFKARGVTGQANPTGDSFDVDYVAHEMGHQFGANHTYNGTTGACVGNFVPSDSHEPGSGSTIMSYAGICGAENLQPHSDDTFHSKGFDEIVAFTTTGSGNSCAGLP